MRDYDILDAKWKGVAQQKEQFQLSRTKLERIINISPEIILIITFAIPIVGGLISLVIG